MKYVRDDVFPLNIFFDCALHTGCFFFLNITELYTQRNKFLYHVKIKSNLDLNNTFPIDFGSKTDFCLVNLFQKFISLRVTEQVGEHMNLTTYFKQY